MIKMRTMTSARFIKWIRVGGMSLPFAAECSQLQFPNLVTPEQGGPKTRRGMTSINAFITRTQCLFIQHMPLQPDLRFERGAGHQFLAAQGTAVDQHLEAHLFQSDVDPV